MSASAAAATPVALVAAPYWRAAGMTYLSYANACGAMVRRCMKEPFKSKALQREHAHFKVQLYAEAAPQDAEYRGNAEPRK